jgi:nucleoside-diphosphate-sugar epimerase
MKYLITGGAGFIGSALTRALAAAGHELVVLDDFSRSRPERLAGVACRIVHADVRDSGAVAMAAHGCEAIIHLAYLQGTQTFYAEPRQVLDVAVRGMSAVLAACEFAGIGELILASSSEVYQTAPVPTAETVPLTVPDPLNPRYSYGGGKIACELMALAWQRAGVLDRVVIVRPHNIIGPDMGREHVIPQFAIRMNRARFTPADQVIEFPIQGTGEETRSFCHIDDCVRQLQLLLDHDDSGIYHLGTADERSIAEVAHAVADCYHREIKVVGGALPTGSPPRRLPDLAKITALGYRPRVEFDQAIRSTVRWYQTHG